MEVSLCTTVLWSNKGEKDPSAPGLKGINGFSGLPYGMQTQTFWRVWWFWREIIGVFVFLREALQQATFLLNMWWCKHSSNWTQVFANIRYLISGPDLWSMWCEKFLKLQSCLKFREAFLYWLLVLFSILFINKK